MPVDLKKLRELEGKATSRPWDHVLSNGWILGGVLKDDYCNVCEQPYKPEDAEFITAARNSLLELLDELERARKLIAHVHELAEEDCNEGAGDESLAWQIAEATNGSD